MPYGLAILFILFTVFIPAFYFWTSYVARKYFLKNMEVEKDYSLEPTVSVLMSAFNEGEHVYKTIKSMRESNYPADKLQIVTYDDYSSDDTWEWIQKAQKDFPNILCKRNAENQGKALTFIEMAQASSGEILLGVDSDCIFDPQAVKEMVVCFKDPKLGAVGGRFGILNVNENFLTQIQAIFYAVSFYFFRPIENYFRKVQCLGGPLVCIRREVYFKILPEIRTRNFLGVPLTNGEDRAITQMILAHGLLTYTNLESKCWTSAPTTWKGYLNQQLRWRRSALGQWVDAAWNARERVWRTSFGTVFGSLFLLNALFIWCLFAVFLIWQGGFFNFLIGFLAIHTIAAPIIGWIYNTAMRKHNPEQVLKNPNLAPLYMAIWFPINIFFITAVAMCTLDDGGWVTRQRKTTT